MVQGVEVEIEGERWITDLVSAENGDSTAAGKAKVKRLEDGEGKGRVGEWRRRRWIRMVRRKVEQKGSDG